MQTRFAIVHSVPTAHSRRAQRERERKSQTFRIQSFSHNIFPIGLPIGCHRRRAVQQHYYFQLISSLSHYSLPLASLLPAHKTHTIMCEMNSNISHFVLFINFRADATSKGSTIHISVPHIAGIMTMCSPCGASSCHLKYW